MSENAPDADARGNARDAFANAGVESWRSAKWPSCGRNSRRGRHGRVRRALEPRRDECNSTVGWASIE